MVPQYHTILYSTIIPYCTLWHQNAILEYSNMVAEHYTTLAQMHAVQL
jgi:hypothetical protein